LRSWSFSKHPSSPICRITVMRFSRAPPGRGGQRNKGCEHALSIVNESAAQHG
jgi:hypothetical protein